MRVVLIPGDGIGKEITQSVLKIDKVLNTNIEWQEYLAGAEYYQENNKLMQDGLLDAIHQNKVVLKGPTATPIGKGFSSINVLLRNEINSFANIRPIKSLKGVNSRYENVDLIIFRENSQDLYTGEEKAIEDGAQAIKTITREASNKIIEFAFEYAIKHHRKKVTCIHKANILKMTDGLFLECFNEIAKKYSIEADSCIVDAACMKLVMNPNQFDVLVAPNLYGDILSDLCAGLIGGLGFAPSVNVSDDIRIYEAVHGSAPDIAGKGIANPIAILLSYGMLLDDYGYTDKANLLLKSIYEIIEEGKICTIDLNGKATTNEFTDAIIERIKINENN